jgi:hypothetical protein
VQASGERELFGRCLREKTDLVPESDTRVVPQIGAEGWPFPIPLVQQDGRWFFDVPAGKQEVLNRRIGRNEIGAIQVCRAYVSAQRDYAGKDRNGDEVFKC